MARRRTIQRVCGGAALGILAILAWLYWAAGYVPEAYREALSADTAVQTSGSDQMLRQAAALAGDLKRPGQWDAVFSADEINGWLAVDLVRNHPNALPAAMSDPRVTITETQVQLFCRYRSGVRDTVLSLVLEPYLVEPNKLAVRIVKARAGLLPLPTARLVEQIGEAAARSQVHCEWLEADGDPVVMIQIPSTAGGEGKSLRLEKLQLGKGQVYAAGTTARRL